MSERKTLFNGWAEGYDQSLEETADFPFEGYGRILETVVLETVVLETIMPKVGSGGAGVGEAKRVL